MSDAENARAFASSWAYRPLASLAKVFTDGDWIESKDQSSSGIRLVQTGNVGEGEFKDRSAKARYIDRSTFERLKCFEVLPGDILISRLPDPIGRSCIVPDSGEKMITAVDCSVVRVDKAVLDKRFLVYYTQSQSYLRAVDERCTGTTRRRISRKNLGIVEIPVPPLDEQKRIVAILDQAFAALDRARANAEANLADAEELFLDVIRKNLDEVIRVGGTATVGSIAEHCLGKMLDKQKNKGVMRPYLRNLNIRWFEIDTSDVLEMKIGDDEIERYMVRDGDLLVCEGGYPGRCAIYQAYSDDVMFFQKALHKVRFEDQVLGKLLMYWLYLEDQRGTLKSHFTGSGIAHFTGKALAAYHMPIADTETIRRAVIRIENCKAKVDKLGEAYRDQLTDIATLRQSLLQQAFSGQLT